MIFRWRWSEALGGLAGEPRLAEFASELLRAYRLGNHLFIVDRDVCDTLLGLPLGDSDLAMLRRLRAEYTQTGHAAESHGKFVEIQSDLSGRAQSIEGIILADIQFLLNSRALEPSILLTENQMQDGWLYLQLMRALKSGHVNAEPRHGGGETIIELASEEIAQKRIVLSIVDSDKDTPQEGDCKKIRSIRRNNERTDWPLTFASSTPCREIENMVPPPVAFDLQSAPDQLTIEQYKAIDGREACPEHEKFWMYVDLKLGVRGERLNRLNEDQRGWYNNKLYIAGIDPETREDDALLIGFGSRVVNQIKADEALLSKILIEIRKPPWSLQFTHWFDSISVYFICGRRISA